MAKLRVPAYWQKLGILVMLGGMTGLLLYASFHHFYQSGLQAEARFLLSYLETLQKVYRLDQGTYAYFDYYGAPIDGIDRCAQPIEAAKLGFFISGCHEPAASAPRYAFQSREILGAEEGGYYLLAKSGSDQQRRSFICFGPQGQELWAIVQKQALKQVETCW